MKTDSQGDIKLMQSHLDQTIVSPVISLCLYQCCVAIFWHWLVTHLVFSCLVLKLANIFIHWVTMNNDFSRVLKVFPVLSGWCSLGILSWWWSPAWCGRDDKISSFQLIVNIKWKTRIFFLRPTPTPQHSRAFLLSSPHNLRSKYHSRNTSSSCKILTPREIFIGCW